MDIVWENTATGIELPRNFCAWIGPLQLGVVLVYLCFHLPTFNKMYMFFPGPLDDRRNGLAKDSVGRVCTHAKDHVQRLATNYPR